MLQSFFRVFDAIATINYITKASLTNHCPALVTSTSPALWKEYYALDNHWK